MQFEIERLSFSLKGIIIESCNICENLAKYQC